MRAAVITFPGSNREPDALQALERISGKRPLVIWHRETELPPLDLIMLPGGFSYGDYLRTGAIAAQSPIMAAVKAAAARGVPVLGVCNGFQILCEAGLLPGILLRNEKLKFICHDVHLRIETAASPFTRTYQAGQVITVPVAHGDGNWFGSDDLVKQLEDQDRVAFRYTDPAGEVGAVNPNGSTAAIAGILSEGRNVLGLMPHPENAIDPLLGSTDGLALFEALAAA